MKKLLSILILSLVVAAFFGATVKAQVYVKVKQGLAADTLKASTTYNNTVNIGGNDLQTVSAHVFINKVSGTPRGTATLYRSLDGVHWETTGLSKTWVSGAWSDTTFIITDTAFYGYYAKVAIVTTSATQKSNYWLTVKSWNKD